MYAVEITSGSCVELSECIVFNTLGFDSFSDEEVQVYPNPVKSNVFIDTTINTEMTLHLYDISGKLVLSVESNSRTTTLQLKNFPSGVYFLNVTTDEKLGVFKIVKE